MSQGTPQHAVLLPAWLLPGQSRNAAWQVMVVEELETWHETSSELLLGLLPL